MPMDNINVKEYPEKSLNINHIIKGDSNAISNNKNNEGKLKRCY